MQQMSRNGTGSLWLERELFLVSDSGHSSSTGLKHREGEIWPKHNRFHWWTVWKRNCRLANFRSDWRKDRRSALFSTDSWVDSEGATMNVREKKLARQWITEQIIEKTYRDWMAKRKLKFVTILLKMRREPGIVINNLIGKLQKLRQKILQAIMHKTGMRNLKNLKLEDTQILLCRES
jgi:hypothetical protein